MKDEKNWTRQDRKRKRRTEKGLSNFSRAGGLNFSKASRGALLMPLLIHFSFELASNGICYLQLLARSPRPYSQHWQDPRSYLLFTVAAMHPFWRESRCWLRLRALKQSLKLNLLLLLLLLAGERLEGAHLSVIQELKSWTDGLAGWHWRQRSWRVFAVHFISIVLLNCAYCAVFVLVYRAIPGNSLDSDSNSTLEWVSFISFSGHRMLDTWFAVSLCLSCSVLLALAWQWLDRSKDFIFQHSIWDFENIHQGWPSWPSWPWEIRESSSQHRSVDHYFRSVSVGVKQT